MNTGSLEHAWTTVMPARWRTVRSVPHTGARNMAIDSALLAAAAGRGEGVFRTYAWDRPTISFGRHESVRMRFNADTIERAGLTAVRRPTGGRALLHAAEVTYSVTMPLAAGVAWTHAYAAVNTLLASALRALGVAAHLVTHEDTVPTRPDGPVCFEQPAVGEIAVDGRKLVGSAVWRERGAYLQHGSILIEDHQSRLADAMQSPIDIPQAATLSQLLSPPPNAPVVAAALEHALLEALALVGHPAPRSTDLELDEALVLRHEDRYRDPAWLWRR